jgi:hypothetical protein
LPECKDNRISCRISLIRNTFLLAVDHCGDYADINVLPLQGKQVPLDPQVCDCVIILHINNLSRRATRAVSCNGGTWKRPACRGRQTRKCRRLNQQLRSEITSIFCLPVDLVLPSCNRLGGSALLLSVVPRPLGLCGSFSPPARGDSSYQQTRPRRTSPTDLLSLTFQGLSWLTRPTRWQAKCSPPSDFFHVPGRISARPHRGHLPPAGAPFPSASLVYSSGSDRRMGSFHSFPCVSRKFGS